MTDRLNGLLGCGNIEDLDPKLVDLLGGTGPIDQFLLESEISSPEEVEWLMGWPEGLREVMRATIRSCVNREPRVPLTVAWAPSYDYQVEVWETADTPPAMTMMLRSRYPVDSTPYPV
jgi:hypothetical protein